MADDVAYAIVALRTRAKADRLNDELRQSEQKYRLHFEQASDVIYSLDRQFRVLTVSPSVQTLLGYDPEELVGVPFPELGIVAPESMAMAVSDAMRVLSGARVSASVYEFVGKDGTRKFGEVSAAPFFEGGEIAGLVSVARDITDRKRAEEELQRTLQNLDEALVGTINTLALVVEHRDPYTAGHQRRVASLAQAMAMEMGLSRDRVEGIRVAGSIHDLGKLFIPAEILSKPGHLSEDELQLIETHPGAAYDILKEVVFPWPVAEIVLQHHERVDGSGYPQHLRGEDTMLEARIIAVADVVEAMASHRPYRAALGIEKALEEIAAQRAVVYDSEAVGACLKLFREKGFELD
jgi:PAS domain S-box-containing protein